MRLRGWKLTWVWLMSSTFTCKTMPGVRSLQVHLITKNLLAYWTFIAFIPWGGDLLSHSYQKRHLYRFSRHDLTTSEACVGEPNNRRCNRLGKLLPPVTHFSQFRIRFSARALLFLAAQFRAAVRALQPSRRTSWSRNFLPIFRKIYSWQFISVWRRLEVKSLKLLWSALVSWFYPFFLQLLQLIH